MFEGRTGFLTGNLVLDLSILAWFLAQLIKTVANLVVNRNLDLKRMVGSGDMPSSHSSFICAATASIGQIYGWQAPLFSLAAVVKTIGVNLAKPALQAASVKAVTPDRRGAAVSTYYIGTDLGQGTSPMIGGRIVDGNGGDYGILFMLFAIPLAVAGMLYAWIMRRMKEKRNTKEVL